MARIELSPETAETIASTSWYLATTGKGEFFGYWQPFTRIRSAGDVHFSRNIYGFRVYQRPRDIAHEPWAKRFFPWTLWRVTPIDVIRVGHMNGFLRARRIRIEERMLEGAEFGPHGAHIRSFAEHLAQLSPWPQPIERADTARRNALISLNHAAQSSHSADLWPETRFAFSYVRRQIVKAKSRTIEDQALRDQLNPFETELHDLVKAFITGTPIPEALAARWSMPADLLPAATHAP